MNTAAMPKERMNNSSAAASLPTADAIEEAGALIMGPYLASAAGALAAVAAPASVSFAPTTGMLARRGGGGGTTSVSFCTAPTNEDSDEASEVTTTTVGARIRVMPTTPIRVADHLLPSRFCSHRCSGYSITARIIDQ